MHLANCRNPTSPTNSSDEAKIKVLAIADDEHADIRLDHAGQLTQRRQRLVFAADIHDQGVRRGHLLQRRDRCVHRSAADLEALRHRFQQALAQRRLGFLVADEGNDTRPVQPVRPIRLGRAQIR
jgi:hypothetical protein